MVEEYQDDMDTKKSCYEKEVVENDEQSGGKRRKVASNKSEGGEDVFSMLHTFSMDNKKVCK